MSTDDHNHARDLGRDRVAQVFRYLEALNQHRNPAKCLLREQPWSMHLRDLPDHPSIHLASSREEILLRVRRPARTASPSPPEAIADWLKRGWEEIDGEVDVRLSRNVVVDGQTIVARFTDDPIRPAALDAWKSRRSEWVANERPAREAAHVYERLYALHGMLDREGGRLELILGDGMLSWKRPGEAEINHPVLFQRVQLGFDPKMPEFTVTDPGREAELYTSLFQSMANIDGTTINQCRVELEQGDYHPLDGAETTGFLKGLVARLSPRGEFVDRGTSGDATEDPRIAHEPLLFLRERSLGISAAITNVLADLRTRPRSDLSQSLLAVVGAPSASGPDNAGRLNGVSEGAGQGGPEEADDILFAKPANAEQRRIAERLDRYGAVLVQGPPGTGKTHTIANLIGHLLAHGESVLVTSHTTKALRVLREQVVEPLRPLCVSVLEGDIEGRRDLEASVQVINEKLSISESHELDRTADRLARIRERLITDLKRERGDLAKARGDEYRDIVVAGDDYPPSEAARLVGRGIGCDDWVPPGVKPGDPLPLDSAELSELYRTAKAVTAKDESELRSPLPELGKLLMPDDFDTVAERRARLADVERITGSEFWETAPGIEGATRLEELSSRVAKVMGKVDASQPWQLDAIAAGRIGGPHRQLWDDLLAMIENACALAADAKVYQMQHAPTLPPVPALPEQKRLVAEILRHLDAGGKLGWLVLLMRPAWKAWIDGVSVGGQRPYLLEHFLALAALIDLTLCRNDLIARWDRQMAVRGAPASDRLSQGQPEASCHQFISPIRDYLGWYGSEWGPIEAELREVGLRWEEFLAETPPNLATHGELLRLRDAVQDRLPKVLATRANAIRRQRIDSELGNLAHYLACVGGKKPAQVVEGLKQSVKTIDRVAYRQHYRRLVELDGLCTDRARRDELLTRLGKVAPNWAAAIRDRQAPHNHGSVPGDVRAAWLWRQLYEALVLRGQKSLLEIQRKIESLDEELRRVTTELIVHRAWAAQVRRATSSQRMALVGWLKTVHKIGKGKGKYAPGLRAEAARLMSECREAVPVWIMPLSRVVENFDPSATRFDVLILDEASQSDAFALVAMTRLLQ